KNQNILLLSYSTYNQFWKEANSTINDLLVQEIPAEPLKPEKDRLTVFQKLATLYIKYVQIFRKLESSYDQVVHPQKRRILRQVLDGTMGRLLEVKDEMVNLEFSEFHYFDDILSDLKLTPNDIEIPIPKYFLHERKKVLQEREQVLGKILAKMGPTVKDSDREAKKMSLEEAIRLVQIHERARQGRLRAKFMREIRLEEEREKLAAQRGAPTLDPDVAATRIQKIWKGFIQRKVTRREREEEMVFIGMGNFQYFFTYVGRGVQGQPQVDRRITQEENEVEYQQALVTIKEKIRQVEGPDIKETMQDQIRQWFIECRDATGKFPDYPDEEDGGSSLLFKEKTPEEATELKEKEEEKGKKKGKKGKKSGKKSGKKKKGKNSKLISSPSQEEEPGWKMQESKFLPAVSEAHNNYESVWRNRDEAANFQQKHDGVLIKEDKRVEVESEIRIQVDELMREELNNLKMALDRDKGKKGKKGKKSGKKKGKKSGKKGKKGKKDKDLTADRTIESLYEEMVQQGVLVKCPQVSKYAPPTHARAHRHTQTDTD
uniref:IQ motif containing with AAA domain 1 n=1 Tax=Ciona savignyi TaxID=51511 RepID=H2YYL1_CIOSA